MSRKPSSLSNRRPAIHLTLLLCFVVVAGCSQGPPDEILTSFRNAEAAFEKAESPEDYLRVADQYQAILDKGYVSAAVLYNQGNAYQRANKKGRAIAAYRHALQFRPADNSVRANLRTALGGSLEPASKGVLDYVFFWQDWLGYRAKFQAAVLFALVTFAVALLRRFRPFSYWFVVVIAFMCMLLMASALRDWYRFDVIKHGVVAEAEVTARKGNATSYEAAFQRPLLEGTEFEVLEVRGDWVHIRLQEDKAAWVPKREVAVY